MLFLEMASREGFEPPTEEVEAPYSDSAELPGHESIRGANRPFATPSLYNKPARTLIAVSGMLYTSYTANLEAAMEPALILAALIVLAIIPPSMISSLRLE